MKKWNEHRCSGVRTSGSSGGFSLLEIVLVTAIMVSVAAVTLPDGLRFYRMQMFDEAVQGVTGTLAKAEAYAFFGKDGQAFGVKILSDSYVLFEGESYTARIPAADESIALPDNVTTEGIDEVVFERATGMPSVSGTLVLLTTDDQSTITISDHGVITKG